MKNKAELKRCGWAGEGLMRDYHDQEWGVVCTDDRVQFEFLVLESAQAGLSWAIILKKREGYRKAFAGFDPKKVAKFGARDVKRLLKDEGIVRNRLKIESTISNAKLFLELQKEFGSFCNYTKQFIKNPAKPRRWKTHKELPPNTPDSDALSKDMKKRGFKFLGSTVLYSHMQATGMVNDHITSCFRFRELTE